MKPPYLVTEDMEYLMRRWSGRVGFGCPDPDFFRTCQRELLAHLGAIFQTTQLIELADLSRRLRMEITTRANGTTVVSIDQIYNQTPYHLESNRVADLDTAQIIGEARRAGFRSLAEQIRSLPNGQPISLVDDGCYSGETLLRITDLMLASGYEVAQVIVGIVIGRSANRLLMAHPELRLVGAYEFPVVIDWVCERDFYVGVPLSGRTAGYREADQVLPCDPEVALPYCLPFGDPISSASIPYDRAITFSRFILDQSIRLWRAVGDATGHPVSCRAVPRLPRDCPRDETPFVEYLASVRSGL